MGEHQQKAKAAHAAAHAALETDGCIPLSVASLNALAAAYWQWQGALHASTAAANVAQARLETYAARLQTELDVLGIEEVTAIGPRQDGQPGQQFQVEVDFRRRLLVLFPREGAGVSAPALDGKGEKNAPPSA